MKHLFTATLLLLALLMPATATAHDFEVDGIYYNILNDNEVEVTSNYENKYSGDISIPATVTYNGTSYSVTGIDYYAFGDCFSLTSINIPNSVTYISEDAFHGCTGLTSITVASDNTKYDSRNNCDAIVETESNTLIMGCMNTTIPNSVTTIGYRAFFSCSGLTSITIPNSVTNIAYQAFMNCTNLTSITIPDNVNYIGDQAFSRCTNLTDVTIGKSVKKLKSGTFEGCRNVKNLYFNAVNCEGLTWWSEGFSAFWDCRLEKIVLGDEVESIPNGFVYGQSTLTSITISNSVTSIGDHAFYGCGITNITIPNSVTSIGRYAFCNSGLTKITIPPSVGSIDHGAFNFCPIDTLYFNAVNCGVGWPQSGDDQPAGCFANTNLKIVIFGDGVKVIPNLLLINNPSLSTIIIPKSVTRIGQRALEGTAWLDNQPEGIIYAGLVAYTYKGNMPDGTTITLREGVKGIADYAFSTCSELTSINIPNSVTNIGNYAFWGCSRLTSFNIPNSVTNIGYYAFNSCPALNEVYSYIDDLSKITMDYLVFGSIDYSGRTLYVPSGTSSAYQADSNWGPYFGNIVEMDAIASSIEVDRTAAVVVEGETLQLNATVLPKNTANKTVAWSSSNPSVATVDSTGLVTGVAVGEVTITAATTDGSNLNASCHVSVKNLSADNAFYMYHDEVLHGDTITIPVYLNNSETILAFQTDIYLPEGFNVVTNDDDEYDVTPSDRLSDDHILIVDRMEDGAVRVLCYTPWSVPITGNDGALFYINVAVPQEAGGEYSIYLRNSLLTKVNYQELYLPDAGAVITVATFIPGDANDSHTVTVTDIVVTAQYVMQQHPSPFVFEAADMNCDGNITVTDIMLIASEINRVPQRAPRRAAMLENGNDRMSGESVCLANGETRTVSVLLDNAMDYCAFQLDLNLPEGLTATHFALTDRAGSHILDVNTIDGGNIRALCYTPALTAIGGHEGALLAFDVTATGNVMGDITVDGIELVTTACETVRLDAFTIGVDNVTAVSETVAGKTVTRVDYFNAAGQQLSQPATGMNIVVTTYNDGTRTVTKVIR